MKKKKDFFQELRDRNVWREIKAYLLGGAAMIPLIWLIIGLLYPDDEKTKVMVTTICTIIFASFLPSVFLFAYHHGEVNDNILAKNTMPINMLRFKLSFFGASRYDPKSDRWLRVSFFPGAPFYSDLNTENVENWGFATMNSY